MDIRSYQPADQDQIIALWEACGLVRPWNDPVKEIQRKLAKDAELFFVGITNNRVVASVMAGYEGHRGWVNYLAVSPDLQRSGYGRQMMQHAELALKSLGCPKVNLQIRESNVQAVNFYQALGYLDDKVIGLGKRLQDD